MSRKKSCCALRGVSSVLSQSLSKVFIKHKHKLGLVLRYKVKRNLLKAVDYDRKTILALRLVDNLLYLCQEDFSRRYLEVRVELVGQLFSVVSDHLYLKLGQRWGCHLAYDPVNYFTRLVFQQISK